MAIIECTEEKYALNLNPYQIFIFINEKTKPYLEMFKDLQERSKSYEIVLLPCEFSRVEEVMDESVDPQLVNVISHSDIVARVMPARFGDYRYQTETFLKRKNPDFDYMSYKLDQFMDNLMDKKSKSYVNTIRRFFQYGNQEFSDFIVGVFGGNLTNLLNMANHYSHIVCTNDYFVAERFTEDFINMLDETQREQLDTIIKDALGYNSLTESKAVFTDFISIVELQSENARNSSQKREKNIKAPDFKIVVTPSEKKRKADAKGDYDINVVKDNGEINTLRFGHRGDKMFYLLTLLFQKAVGGFPTKFFSFDSSKMAIKKIYDEMFRSGGDVWVNSMAEDSHHLSVIRSHAKTAIEKGNDLDLNTAYWCNLDTTSLNIGLKRKKLQIRRVRLSDDRIIINDNGKLTQHLVGLPSLEQVVDFVSPNAAKVMNINLGRIGYGKTGMLDE